MTCWHADRMKTVVALGALALAGAMPFGCASPQGVLFNPIASQRVWPPPPDNAI